MGASSRMMERKNGKTKGNCFGEEGESRSRLEKRRGGGVCRCVLKGERGGSLPFLIKWLNWFNLVIIILIEIGISIPDPVAALGGILPPGCGARYPARRLTIALDQCL